MALIIDRLTAAPGSFLIEAVLVHDIPGRLRLVAPSLKGKPDQVGMLRARLKQADPVRAVHFNTLTGSIIVEYDIQVSSRETVFQELNRAGCSVVSRRPRVSAPAAQAALKAVLHCVLDLAVENVIMAVI
jgi:hypothetical protein